MVYGLLNSLYCRGIIVYSFYLYLLPFLCNMGTPSKYPQLCLYCALYRFVISVGVKVLVVSYSSVLRVDSKFSSSSYIKQMTCVGTLLQNESNSDVVRFTTHESGRGVESCVNTKF